jgi:hypothetical protein
MKLHLPFLLILSLSLSPLSAQHELLTDYDWEAAPVKPDAALFADANDLLLKRNILSQYMEKPDEVVHYKVFHVQRHLRTGAAVDANTTVQLSTGHIHEVISIKARSIDPDGRITELRSDAFKKSLDDRNRQNGIYFAFEGLRPGSTIEYLILTRERADLRGDAIRLQFVIPVVEQRYEVLVPDDWNFVFKGYNNTPAMAVDSSLTGIIHHHLRLENTPALEDEESSNSASYRMYIIQKLDGIPSRKVNDYSGYRGAAQTYHSALYPPVDSKTKKELAARLKKVDLAFSRDLEDKIRTIDRYIRNNFNMVDVGGDKLADLGSILRTKDCSEFGLQRLYCNLFREAGIEHQVVVTCDRTEFPFDPEFEAYNYLQQICLYFPGVDKFLDPTDLTLGLGYLSPEFTGTHGLFIRNIEIGGVFTGIGSVKPIPELPSTATRHDIRLVMHLSEDATEADIELENGVTGYYARLIQNFYPYLNEDQRRDLLKAYQDHLLEGSTKQDLQVEHAEQRFFGLKPFTMKAKVHTSKFTAPAGDEVLLKVGDLIGPQMEMYAEKVRKLPADSPYNRYYDRQLTIHLPKDWKCTDLSPLAIHKVMEIDGKVRAEFRSTAVLKDGVISVEVVEYYSTNHVPVEHFEAYRSVINAAADFNKRSLLLARAN